MKTEIYYPSGKVMELDVESVEGRHPFLTFHVDGLIMPVGTLNESAVIEGEFVEKGTVVMFDPRVIAVANLALPDGRIGMIWRYRPRHLIEDDMVETDGSYDPRNYGAKMSDFARDWLIDNPEWDSTKWIIDHSESIGKFQKLVG